MIATVGTEEKAQLARDAGADHVIVYAKTDFAEATRALVGDKGVDVAYDSVGKDTWERSLSVLRPRGMLVVFGNSSGPVPPVEPQRWPPADRCSSRGRRWAIYMRTPEELFGRTSELFALVQSGKLHVRIGAEYPLAEAAQAHRDLEARKTVGKAAAPPVASAEARRRRRRATSSARRRLPACHRQRERKHAAPNITPIVFRRIFGPAGSAPSRRNRRAAARWHLRCGELPRVHAANPRAAPGQQTVDQRVEAADLFGRDRRRRARLPCTDR